MAQIASFTTPAETFAVGRALSSGEGITVELERLVPTGEAMIPFLWVWGEELSPFEDRLEREPGIGSVETLSRTESGVLYRLQWSNDLSSIVRGLFEFDFTLIDGVGTAERWEFEIRFRSAEVASEFQAYLHEYDVPHELERVQSVVDVDPPNSYGLTPEQREALTLAYQSGYFCEPREAVLKDVADALGISPSAASGRLRRGHARLLEQTLL